MARKTKARETFSRYDTANYLKTEDDVAAYLEAVMDEAGDDAAFVTQALGNVARARGMVQLARDTGLTREGLYKALSANGNPSFGTVLKVIRALGLKLAPQRVGASARSAKRRVA
jgi:probable addiction module antidote protein